METNSQGDLLQSNPAKEPAPTAAESKLDTFHTALCVTIAALIITNLSLIGMFAWETRQLRMRLNEHSKIISRYERIQEPLVKDALFRLEAFSQQDRNFETVIRKYPVFFPKFALPTAAAQGRTTSPTSAPAKQP